MKDFPITSNVLCSSSHVAHLTWYINNLANRLICSFGTFQMQSYIKYKQTYTNLVWLSVKVAGVGCLLHPTRPYAQNATIIEYGAGAISAYFFSSQHSSSTPYSWFRLVFVLRLWIQHQFVYYYQGKRLHAKLNVTLIT